MHFLLKLGLSTAIISGAIVLSRVAIAELGELVHFNCHSGSCELTHEPLIGSLKTLKLQKADLIKSEMQPYRLLLITKSAAISFSESRNTNAQLIVQREAIDRFINQPDSDTLSVRTHRPGVLWVILVGVIGGAIAGVRWIQLM